MKVKAGKKNESLRFNKINKSGASSLNTAVQNVKRILKTKDSKDEVKPNVDAKPTAGDLIRVKGLIIRKNKPASKQQSEPSEKGLLYIGHIPHGFYEDQIRSFFSQMGRVTNVRVCRSKKTGKSKGFAFVEFQYREVAEKAAESLKNYLMFNRLLKVELIDPAKVHDGYFKGKPWSENNYPKLKNRLKRIQRNNQTISNVKHTHFVKKSVNNLSSLSKKLKSAGIDITFNLGDVQV